MKMMPPGAFGIVAVLAVGTATAIADPPRRSDVWIAGVWSESEMKTMATALEPTGMTGFTGRPLDNLPPAARAKKRAWLERRKGLARRLGIRKLHFAVHTYHRQPNFPDSAVRVGILGEPWYDAIAPHATKDKRWWTYCKSHDEFRDAMIHNIQLALDGGADVIHLEDYQRNETQCVCDRCAEKFRDALLHDRRLARFLEPLRAMGIADLRDFHIRRYLLAHTKGDQKQRQRQFQRMGALWQAWSEFKDNVAFDFLRVITDAGRAYAGRRGRPVAFVQHFWYFRRQDLGMSDDYDGVWPETPLLYYATQPAQRTAPEYRVGIRVYPPNGVMGSEASVLRGAGYGCPPILIGHGGAWYHRLPFKRGGFGRLLQIWTAEVYASGGTMQYLYALPEKQLLGRGLYRRLRTRLMPQFYDRERSPVEYRCPLDAVGQYTRFIRAHPDFYDGCEPPRYVLLLKAERGYSLGPGAENIFAWAQLLDDAHIPYRVLLDGGDRKRVRLDADALHGYHRVVALGQPDQYVAAQIKAFRDSLANGGALVVVGHADAWRRALGRRPSVVLPSDLGARYQLSDRDPKLTDAVRRALDASAVETNAGPNVLLKLERLSSASDWRLHVVNREYRWLEDRVVEKRNVTISLDADALGLGRIEDIRAYSPDGDEFAQVQAVLPGPKFTLQRLSVYTVVTFRALAPESAAPGR